MWCNTMSRYAQYFGLILIEHTFFGGLQNIFYQKRYFKNPVEWILQRSIKLFDSKVFQILLKSGWKLPPPPPPFGGLENFTGVNFFIGCWEPEEEWFWLFKPFSKLKMTFCKYWASSKIKISMTCQYKEYEVKIEIVQEQGLQLRKWSFYWVIT